MKKPTHTLSVVTHLIFTVSIIFLVSWYHAKTVQQKIEDTQAK